MSYRTGTWAGRVYDGPLEGEHRDEERPYFEFWWSPPSNFVICGPNEIPPMGYAYRVAYRWSDPLRAWVFDWRTAPQPRADELARLRRDQALHRSTLKCSKHSRGDWAL